MNSPFQVSGSVPLTSASSSAVATPAQIPVELSLGNIPGSLHPAANPSLNPQQHIQPWQYVRLPSQTAPGCLSERDIKTLKRKQANRDAARRSKIRRKMEAQALAARLKQLKDENNNLEKEVECLRDALSKVVELNRRRREALVDQGISLDGHPVVDVEFHPPPVGQLPAGPLVGDRTASIPDVLEFSRQYTTHLGLPMDSAARTEIQLQEGLGASPGTSAPLHVTDALVEGDLDNEGDEGLFLETSTSLQEEFSPGILGNP